MSNCTGISGIAAYMHNELDFFQLALVVEQAVRLVMSLPCLSTVKAEDVRQAALSLHNRFKACLFVQIRWRLTLVDIDWADAAAMLYEGVALPAKGIGFAGALVCPRVLSCVRAFLRSCSPHCDIAVPSLVTALTWRDCH